MQIQMSTAHCIYMEKTNKKKQLNNHKTYVHVVEIYNTEYLGILFR